MTLIKVKQIFVRFSATMGGAPRETTAKIISFWKSLGDNLPKYSEYDGDGIQCIFCVDIDFDSKAFCQQHDVEAYSEDIFETDSDKFNSQHQILPTHSMTGEPYKLEKI
jgi:hypothetical protein